MFIQIPPMRFRRAPVASSYLESVLESVWLLDARAASSLSGPSVSTPAPALTHTGPTGKASMVDVSEKILTTGHTLRSATSRGKSSSSEPKASCFSQSQRAASESLRAVGSLRSPAASRRRAASKSLSTTATTTTSTSTTTAVVVGRTFFALPAASLVPVLALRALS